MAMSLSYDGLNETLADITRRLGDLETGTKLGNSSISQGALKVLDAAGQVRTQIGQLPDGTFGVSVMDDGGNALSLAASLLGVNAATSPAAISVPSAATLTFATSGPQVIATTVTGKLLIIGQFRGQMNGAYADGLVGALQVRDAAANVIVAPSTAAGALYGVAPAAGNPYNVPIIGLVTGLTPNTQYFARWLYGAAGVANASAGSVAAATIVAFPL